MIAKIEIVVWHGGFLAIAMPRGSGKTSLCLAAVEWATFCWGHPYAFLLAATDRTAKEMLIDNLKANLQSEGPLLDDFPEILYPIRALENEPRRCLGQRYEGQPTRIQWEELQIVLPAIPGSAASGAVIRGTGLTGNVRGPLRVQPGGRTVRPSLVLCDDPQTDESARSPLQTDQRMKLLTGAVKGMAGPGRNLGVLVPCTVIERGDLSDQILDRKLHPEFRGERTKTLYRFPANRRLWDQYARLRAESLGTHDDIRLATTFYRLHQHAMDRGAKPAWPERFDPGEISAVQHAMNLFIENPRSFAAEQQNEPLVPESDLGRLTAQAVADRLNGRSRGEVPIECQYLTAGVDLHKKLLFYVVLACAQDWTGYVVDYGTYPQQDRYYFTEATATRTLGRAHPGLGEDGAIQAGLEVLLTRLQTKGWARAGKAGMASIGKCLVDSAWKPGIVEAVRHRMGGGLIEGSRGIGIGAGDRPMSSYRQRPGERHGHHWYTPSLKGTREFRYVAVDTNYWKTFVHERLEIGPGERGSFTLWGKSNAEHDLFAAHVAESERWDLTTGHGRTVHQWRQLPNRPDNHWFDCLEYCAVAASILGCGGPAEKPSVPRRRRPPRITAL